MKFHWLTFCTAPLSLLAAADESEMRLELLGRYTTGIFDQRAAEIVAYYAPSQSLYVTNAALRSVDVVSLADPSAPELDAALSVRPYGASVHGLDIHGDLLAVGVVAYPHTDPGSVLLFTLPDRTLLAELEVGAYPDSIQFSPDGRFIVTANEGKADPFYQTNPPGTVSIIEVPEDRRSFSQEMVTTLGFEEWDGETIDGGHPGHPDFPNSRNFDPEHVAITPDGRRAYVSLQCTNAVAIVDLEEKRIRTVRGLGHSDHLRHPIDASDEDGGIRLRPWPVRGLYQPDTLTFAEIGGRRYLFTANEGDPRDYPGWSDVARVRDLQLDRTAFPNAEELQLRNNLGQLKVSSRLGNENGNGHFKALYSFGARSFAIWTEDLELVYESGDAFARVAAREAPASFNTNHRDNQFESRSDDHGVEPEGLTVAELGGRPYAFITFERFGGIVVVDVSDVRQPRFVPYTNNRRFDRDPATCPESDLGPEYVLIIQAEDSPTGEPLMVVTHEVSGSVSIHRIVLE